MKSTYFPYYSKKKWNIENKRNWRHRDDRNCVSKIAVCSSFKILVEGQQNNKNGAFMMETFE